MSSSKFKVRIKDELPRAIEEKIEYTNMGGDPVYALLTLALEELKLIESNVRCPYCRKQVLAEIRTLENSLNLAQIAFLWQYSGIWAKLRLILKALYLIAKIQFIHLTKAF